MTLHTRWLILLIHVYIYLGKLSSAVSSGPPSPAPTTPVPSTSVTMPGTFPTPMPTQPITPSTQYQYFDKLQDIDGKQLGTLTYLSNCPHECSLAVCPKVSNSDCKHGQYLLLGYASIGKVVVYQRNTNSAFNDAMGQTYIPMVTSGTNQAQALNWTCSVSDKL